MDSVKAKFDTFRELSFENSTNDDSGHNVSSDIVFTGFYCHISPLGRINHLISTSILDDRVPPDKDTTGYYSHKSPGILDDRVPPDKVVTGYYSHNSASIIYRHFLNNSYLL